MADSMAAAGVEAASRAVEASSHLAAQAAVGTAVVERGREKREVTRVAVAMQVAEARRGLVEAVTVAGEVRRWEWRA